MKKSLFVILLVSVLLTSSIVSYASSNQIDISNLSREELLELRDRIDIRLGEMEENTDILFDDKDVAIQWLGFNTDFLPYKNILCLLRTKQTNRFIMESPRFHIMGFRLQLQILL